MKIWILLLCFLPITLFAQSQSGSNLVANAYLNNNKEYEELLIPNAFTPNSDGQNDIFKVVNISDQKILDFKIFNRWGTVLYRTTDVHAGWDGTYKGQQQPFGVYGYVIRIAYTDGYVA